MAMIKIDFANAFNKVSRDYIFDAVHRHFPELLPWVFFCYSSCHMLFAGEMVILGKSGVQQGDPLGPLLFAIAIHSLVLDLNQHCPDLVLHSWYLDDGIDIGPIYTLVTFVDLLIQNSSSYGLSLNLSKCEIFWPSGRDKWEAFPADMCRIEAAGVELLVGPISTCPSFCNTFTKKRCWWCGRQSMGFSAVDWADASRIPSTSLWWSGFETSNRKVKSIVFVFFTLSFIRVVRNFQICYRWTQGVSEWRIICQIL